MVHKLDCGSPSFPRAGRPLRFFSSCITNFKFITIIYENLLDKPNFIIHIKNLIPLFEPYNTR